MCCSEMSNTKNTNIEALSSGLRRTEMQWLVQPD